MKKLTLLSTLCLSMVSATIICSCSKKNEAKPVVSAASLAVGYWFYYPALYGNGNTGWNGGMLLRSDGTERTYDFYYHPTSTDTTNAFVGNGTYTLKGDSIFISTVYPDGEKFYPSGVINKSAVPLTLTITGGTWVKQ